jgi:hypothetical protein
MNQGHTTAAAGASMSLAQSHGFLLLPLLPLLLLLLQALLLALLLQPHQGALHHLVRACPGFSLPPQARA